MEQNYNKREQFVGLFIISVVILLLSAVVMIGFAQDWFKNYVIYYTIFDEGYNLQVNAAVKLSNTDIGKVKQVTLVENKVKVRLAILEQYSSRIRAGSQATVKSPTFIGDEYVSIAPGKQNAPLIQVNGEIPSKGKKTIPDLLNEFQVEETYAMFVKILRNSSELTQIMRDPDGPLLKTLSDVNLIVNDLQSGKGSVGGILKSKELLDSILDKLERVDEILNNISLASAKTPEAVDRLNENLTSVKKIGDGINECIIDVKNIIKEVEISTGVLKKAITNIEEGSEDFPRFTNAAKKGIQEVRDSVEGINKVFKSLQKNVFIRSNIPLEPDIDPIDAGTR